MGKSQGVAKQYAGTQSLVLLGPGARGRESSSATGWKWAGVVVGTIGTNWQGKAGKKGCGPDTGKLESVLSVRGCCACPINNSAAINSAFPPHDAVHVLFVMLVKTLDFRSLAKMGFDIN